MADSVFRTADGNSVLSKSDLHLRSSMEFTTTVTEPTLWTNAPATGPSNPNAARVTVAMFSVIDRMS